MSEPKWTAITPRASRVFAQPEGVCTLVCDFIEGLQLLRITAPEKQMWSYSDAREARCGPDGDPQALLSSEKCLLPAAPVGALIGKIGGSTASFGDGNPAFVVGRECVIRVPEYGGPLYLTINDEHAGMENNAGSISVVIECAPAPKKSEPQTPPPKTYLIRPRR